jgi:hypothetical protein
MDEQRDYAEEAYNQATMREEAWPEPTDSRPDSEDLQDMLTGEIDAEATDGCYVEPDGVCEHGHPSWPLYLGLI